MRKKTGFFAGVWLCISMCLLLLVSTPVKAEDQNMVTLNFIGASIEDGKAMVKIDEGCKAKITLCTKDSDYKDCSISGNGMQVDLLEKNYYLKVDIIFTTPSIEYLPSISSSDIRFYINEKSYNINSNPYIKLDPHEFSGDLNIRAAYEPGSSKPGYPDDIQITGTYDGFGMEIRLNGEKIGSESKTILGTGKGYASGEIYNLIRIQLAFGDGNIGTVTVNGMQVNLPEGTSDSVEFAAAPASTYTIEVTKSSTVTKIKRSIIWESDNANNTSLKEDELLKHGSVEIIGIKDEDGNPVELKDIHQSTSHGYGSIVPGSVITFRATPEYGYQLDSITINGQSLTPLEDTFTYTYTMPDTNVHICGIFTKKEDQTELNTDKVKNALIQLAENEITSGNSRLMIKDAQLTPQQQEAFEKAAGDYRIVGYFDIKLAQILYKNSSTNMWVNNIAALKNPAKVSLQLGTDLEVESNDLIVIHENSDGTYEVIPASFDSAAKTVMFQTKGFSNYAVAYKKSETTTENSTKETTTEGTTGDTSETTTSGTAKAITNGMTEATTSGTTEATKDAVTVSPKTGEDMNLPVFFILMLVSAMGCLYAIRKEKS